jgi:hypothetical protein
MNPAEVEAAIKANEDLRFTRFEGPFPGEEWIKSQHLIVHNALAALSTQAPMPAASAEPVDDIARALYQFEPLMDQETDLDGRSVGDPYVVTWDSIVECYPDAHGFYLEKAQAAVASIRPAAPPVQAPMPCVGCEGRPAPENNPCAVCGASAAPMPGEVGEQIASMQALSDWLVANDVDMKLPDECGDPADAAALIQSLQLAVERWKTEAADYAEEVGCRRGEIEELQDQLTAAQRVKDEAVEALRWIENLPKHCRLDDAECVALMQDHAAKNLAQLRSPDHA